MLEIANAYRIESPGDLRSLIARLKKRGFVARTPLIETAPVSRINIEDSNKNSHVAGYINPVTSLLCVYEPLYIYPVTRIPSGRLGDYVSQSMKKVANVYKIERQDSIFTALEEEDFAIVPQPDERVHGIKIRDDRDDNALAGHMDLPVWQNWELFAELSTRLDDFAREYYPEGYFCI